MNFDHLLDYDQLLNKGKTIKNIGLDSEDQCFNIEWYKSYPKKISYKFNDLGFRDINHESLDNKFFAIGDSFTVGLGQPYQETWPVVLETLLNEPVVKLATNGASNDWIQLVFTKILNCNPTGVFIMLSFIHRELVLGKTSIQHLHYNNEHIFDNNWANKLSERTTSHMLNIQNLASRRNIPVFFSAVPEFDVIKRSSDIRNQLIPYDRLIKNPSYDFLKKFNDLGRDYIHFGSKSSNEIALNFYNAYLTKLS